MVTICNSICFSQERKIIRKSQIKSEVCFCFCFALSLHLLNLKCLELKLSGVPSRLPHPQISVAYDNKALFFHSVTHPLCISDSSLPRVFFTPGFRLKEQPLFCCGRRKAEVANPCNVSENFHLIVIFVPSEQRGRESLLLQVGKSQGDW